jgi:hypothetical protein
VPAFGTLPTPFDASTVAAVADAHGVDATRLATLVRAHQSAIRSYASVSGWVYELRRAYPRDALVARRPAAFYLAVEPTVWPEFDRAVGVDVDDGDDDPASTPGPEAAALRALHDRVLRAAVDRPDDDRASMVVVR